MDQHGGTAIRAPPRTDPRISGQPITIPFRVEGRPGGTDTPESPTWQTVGPSPLVGQPRAAKGEGLGPGRPGNRDLAARPTG